MSKPQTVDVVNFVALNDVDPLLFYKPYYLGVNRPRTGAPTSLLPARDPIQMNIHLTAMGIVTRTLELTRS